MAKTKRKNKAGTAKAEAAHRKALFIEAYITNGGNGKQAAIEAGYSAKTAEQQASRLLRDVKVRETVDARKAAVLADAQVVTGVTVERTLRELGRVAYFDPRKMFGADKNLLDVCDMDDDTAAAIASVEVTEEFEGNGKDRKAIGFTKKLRVFDKNSAIDKAMKHLGLLKEKIELTGAGGGPMQTQAMPQPDYAKVQAIAERNAARQPR